MANSPKSSAKPGRAPAPPVDPYVRGDMLPVPEVIEKDSDSVWALWTEATKEPADKYVDTQPVTQLMGLPDFPTDLET